MIRSKNDGITTPIPSGIHGSDTCLLQVGSDDPVNSIIFFSESIRGLSQRKPAKIFPLSPTNIKPSLGRTSPAVPVQALGLPGFL